MKRVTGLHIILGSTDDEQAIELAMLARKEGAAVVQLRDKVRGDAELLSLARTLRAILDDVTFIINDRVDIAREVNADGVHLGQNDMPIAEARALLGTDAIIGISTSNLQEALEAERAGANYLGFGHLFPTRSKMKESTPKTVEELRAVAAAVSIPVIAIGGITESNVNGILIPGLGGIAVIGAVNESENPRKTIRNFVKMLEEHHAIHT
ncbi:MAG TPA: thiamine phosphate synthase [Candidatus Kapabacteria bacterium]|nr:thiamine phosphate synthase [Candidatus Kapabacteria bacterium]